MGAFILILAGLRRLDLNFKYLYPGPGYVNLTTYINGVDDLNYSVF